MQLVSKGKKVDAKTGALMTDLAKGTGKEEATAELIDAAPKAATK